MQLSGREVQELRRHFHNIQMGLGIARLGTSHSAPEAGVIDVAHNSARTVSTWLEALATAEAETSLADAAPIVRQPADQSSTQESRPLVTPVSALTGSRANGHHQSDRDQSQTLNAHHEEGDHHVR